MPGRPGQKSPAANRPLASTALKYPFTFAPANFHFLHLFHEKVEQDAASMLNFRQAKEATANRS
jgi:hypothetical protein